MYIKSPILNSVLLYLFIFILGKFQHIVCFIYFSYFLSFPTPHSFKCMSHKGESSVLLIAIFPVPGKNLLNFLNK